MGIEIERKFLVHSDAWRIAASAGVFYRQGYLGKLKASGCNVRVRSIGQDEAWLTIKSRVDAMTRLEYEYPIPMDDAVEILTKLCSTRVIEKKRYKLAHAELIWEIDVFEGMNVGLVLAEVELTAPDQPVILPFWVGKEVTTDKRYYNSYLASVPYSTW